MPEDPTVPAAHPAVPWLTPARRAWLYRVVVAMVLLGSALEVTTDEVAGRVLGLAAALLGTSVAALHTPTAAS